MLILNQHTVETHSPIFLRITEAKACGGGAATRAALGLVCACVPDTPATPLLCCLVLPCLRTLPSPTPLPITAVP